MEIPLHVSVIVIPAELPYKLTVPPFSDITIGALPFVALSGAPGRQPVIVIWPNVSEVSELEVDIFDPIDNVPELTIKDGINVAS